MSEMGKHSGYFLLFLKEFFKTRISTEPSRMSPRPRLRRSFDLLSPNFNVFSGPSGPHVVASAQWDRVLLVAQVGLTGLARESEEEQ